MTRRRGSKFSRVVVIVVVVVVVDVVVAAAVVVVVVRGHIVCSAGLCITWGEKCLEVT